MRILVTGAGSGLGEEIANKLIQQGHEVIGVDINDETTMHCNVENPAPFFEWAGKMIFDSEYWGAIDVLINCAGINSNEWFEDLDYGQFIKVMNTNAWSFVAMTQQALPWLLKSDVKTVINIVSNAAHIPMTSSLAYNASKAAGLMITKQMAHELTPRHGITVFSISPNKLAGTGMSKQIEDNVCKTRGWTPEFAAEYQKKALMHGRETDPAAIADYIAYTLDSGNYRFMSGTDVPFGK